MKRIAEIYTHLTGYKPHRLSGGNFTGDEVLASWFGRIAVFGDCVHAYVMPTFGQSKP